VDANAETVSSDRELDFGRSRRIVHDYLQALDRRVESPGVGTARATGGSSGRGGLTLS
jgi:hypothetical protein